MSNRGDDGRWCCRRVRYPRRRKIYSTKINVVIVVIGITNTRSEELGWHLASFLDVASTQNKIPGHL